MIKKDVLEEVIFKTIKRSSTYISDDVYESFQRAVEQEDSPNSKNGFISMIQSLDISRQKESPACPDTGWPLFFCKIGNEALIEGGIMALEDISRKMVAKATKEGYIRATMKHPLTGYDPGTNVGENIPHFTYKFVPGKDIEITYAAKGGGSEVFGGTRYQMLAFADGLIGIKKFIIDSYIASTRAGAICPPAVLGVGIGGTANVAANLAKEAACLRMIGSHHPDPVFAQLEEDLYKAINSLGIGAMGAGGKVSVFSVNIEYAYTHIAGIAVATSSNCCVARRATYRICANGDYVLLASPNWFDGR